MSASVRFILAIVWTAAVLLGLSVPASDLPDLGIPNGDKLAHFGLFFVLGLLWMSALVFDISIRSWIVLTSGILFGIGTELFQGLLPFDRQPDALDAVANAIGVISGIIVYRTVRRVTFASDYRPLATED